MPRSPDATFRTLEHTADLRLQLQAPTPAALYRVALHALAEVVRGQPVREAACGSAPLALSGTDPADLLVCLLNEALFRLETEGQLVVDGELAQVTATRLAGTLRLLPVAGMPGLLDVKAATYHELVWQSDDRGIVAEITLDL